ncbi:hypothetical protein Tco_1467639, partial [Tanacetum coccineum]
MLANNLTVLTMLNAPWPTCDQKFKVGIVTDAELRGDMGDLGITFLSCLVPDTDFTELRSEEEKHRWTCRKLAKLHTTKPKAYDLTFRMINYKMCRRALLQHLHEINGLANVVFTNKEWNKDVNQDWYSARDRSALPKDVFGLLKLIIDTTGHLLELKKPDWDKKELLTHITNGTLGFGGHSLSALGTGTLCGLEAPFCPNPVSLIP